MEKVLESSNMEIKNTSSKLKNISTNKTKKKQTPQLSNSEKSRLWNLLDTDKSAKSESAEMECVYKFNIDSCESCESQLVTMEDGFPTCSNKECGRFYRDVLDFSAEWRYYGADDKNSNDPTRCGNPINPLLQESSYGCKVLYTNKSS